MLSCPIVRIEDLFHNFIILYSLVFYIDVFHHTRVVSAFISFRPLKKVVKIVVMHF